MSQQSNIQEVFGKFAVELDSGAVLFDTREEALIAETEFLKGAEFREEAAAYCAYKGLEGKNAKGKANVLTDYFAWVEAGRPEAAPVEEKEEKDQADADSVATDVATDTAESDEAVEF